jgi:hypothetical protein
MKRGVDGKAIHEVLCALETRLEAYLAEWRRDLGIQERPEAGIDRKERRPAATEREKKGVESPAPNSRRRLPPPTSFLNKGKE